MRGGGRRVYTDEVVSGKAGAGRRRWSRVCQGMVALEECGSG